MRAVAIAGCLALLPGCGSGSSSSGSSLRAPVPPVPAAYQAIYQELSDKLTNYKNTVNAAWDGTNRRVSFATSLLPAHSSVGPGLLAPRYLENVVLPYLDRLAELGAHAVTLQINYPILTPAYIGDPQPYIAFYTQLAAAVHARGLKLLVEHNVLLPGFSEPDPTSYYAALTKQRFSQERYLEIRTIVQQIQPDYLSLVTEPETFAATTRVPLNAAGWRTYVVGILAQLAIDVPGYSTKLGAGSGTWEPVDFITAFAQVPGLDYIDLHVFPPASSSTDFLARLLEWPDLVRTIDASKNIVMSEAWLHKTAAAELGGGALVSDFLARNVWSFWQPLDELFLDAMARTAHYKNYELITPFWSHYFLTYLDYNDPSLAGLDAFELMTRASQAAFGAVLAGEFTGTGVTFQRLATTPLSR